MIDKIKTFLQYFQGRIMGFLQPVNSNAGQAFVNMIAYNILSPVAHG